VEPSDLALIHRYLNGDLEGAELAAFYEKVSSSPALQEALARLSFDEVLTSEVLSEQRAAEEAARESPVRRKRTATRRFSGPPPSFAWGWALAAAGLLVGLAALVSIPASKPPKPAPALPKAVARPGPAEPDRPRKEQKTRIDQTRRDAERDLQEVTRQREELEKEPSRQEDLERVRRIEAEMREFVKRLGEGRPAAEPPKPAPEPPPQEPAENKPRPAAGTETAIARVERAEGEAFLLTAVSRSPARPGQDVRPGQGLQVGPQGLVEVAYPDRTRVTVTGDVEFREPVEPGPRGKRLWVAKGTVTAEVSRQPAGQAMIFLTPHGDARVLGTTLRIVVDPGSTRLEVTEGKVRLTRSQDGKSVEVTAGHLAVAATGVDLAARPLPLEDIVLLPRDGQAVKGSYGAWTVERDKGAIAGFAWQGASFGDRPDLKGCSHLLYSFRADADRDYFVWVRGSTAAAKEPLTSDHLIVVVPESVVTPSPAGAASLGGSADFNGHCERPGYWWLSGNEYPALPGSPVTVRFLRPGVQTLRVYAWEGPMRVDAIWLSTTQKTRPEANQHGPVRAGK
jgi:ferric-dicitrate binding protein FerR (iron transport regulator)